MPGFSSTYSPLFLALILIIAAAVSYFFYRKSQLNNLKKYFLIALKTLAIFLLISLFIEPVLSSLVKKPDSKLNIVLLDNSRSNTVTFRNSSKTEEIRKIAVDNNLFEPGLRIFTFSNTLNPITSIDSFIANGYETDLESVLNSLKNVYPEGTYNSITIISDGIFNSGGNPLYTAKTFQSPFLTFAVGDTNQQKDLVIKKIICSQNAFTNTPVKIRVEIKAFKNITGPSKIDLLREGSVISTKSLNITSDEENYETEFEVNEKTPGKVKFRVQAEHKEGEITYRNNYSDFYITFLDNKVTVLVISGGPGYDNEFTGSVLKRIGNYNIIYRTAKSPGEFYEGTVDQKLFAELSAVFLLNFPANQTASNLVQEISAGIRLFKVPVVFFAGKNTDYQKLNTFDELLPFTISRPSQGESLFSIQSVNSDDNPLLKLQLNNTAVQIFRNVSGIIPKPGAITLATDRSTGEPVMITRTSGELKSTAFLGYGLWRWKLNHSSDGEKTLEGLLTESINLTLQKEKKTKFRIYPAKDFFDLKQQVTIIAEVFDENFLPTRNALIKGRILKPDGTQIADLNFTSEENRYIAVNSPLLPGDYIVEGEAELGGVYYASGKNRFCVDSLNTEFTETRTNTESLIQLSQNTGGRFISLDSAASIGGVIRETFNSRIQSVATSRENKFNLWENRYMLAVILLIFAFEWVLRKRNNIS